MAKDSLFIESSCPWLSPIFTCITLNINAILSHLLIYSSLGPVVNIFIANILKNTTSKVSVKSVIDWINFRENWLIFWGFGEKLN